MVLWVCSGHSQAGGVKDIVVDSAHPSYGLRQRESLSYCTVWPSPLGRITQAFSAALSQQASSMSACYNFGNYITAFNPLLWTS